MREKTKKKKTTVDKSVPPNLLVGKTMSIVKLIIFVLAFVLKSVLPNNEVCVSENLVLSNKLRYMMIKLLRGVRRSLLCKEQWRKN